MPERKPFYGFGNYLTDDGATLGSEMIFVLAEDKPAARKLLVKELSINGELVPNSLKVCPGSQIPASWLMAAAMESDEAAWSSGVSMPSIQAVPARKKEYLS